MVQGGDVGHDRLLIRPINSHIGGVKQGENAELVLGGGKGVVEIDNPLVGLFDSNTPKGKEVSDFLFLFFFSSLKILEFRTLRLLYLTKSGR